MIYLFSNYRMRSIHYKLEIICYLLIADPHLGAFVIKSHHLCEVVLLVVHIHLQHAGGH